MSGHEITDEMVGRAWTVLREAPGWPPYIARARDYVSPDTTGDERERELMALKAADEEADRMTEDLIRRALAAALECE